MSLKRQDLWIGVALFVLFVVMTTPGISWGAPYFWHPDELAKIADKVIEGNYKIDATYFNHPFLPQNGMVVVGKIIYGMGLSRTAYILAVRFLNVLLSGAIILLVYLMTRLLSGGRLAALLAAVLALSSSEIALNARIAHDDMALAFFTTLAVLSLVQYRRTGKRGWLYFTFFGIGLAASSKYNGVSLALAPLALLTWDHRLELKGGNFGVLKLLLAGAGLAILGFGLGSPQTITNFPFFIRIIGETMLHHAEFNAGPDSVIGIFGQWQVLNGLLGSAAFVLFLVAVVYETIGLIWKDTPQVKALLPRRRGTEAVLLSILSLDLPMLMVQNYPARFFVPIVPLLAILAGLFMEDLYLYGKKRGAVILAAGSIAAGLAVIALSMLRVASITLLYLNDARIAASGYVTSLPASASVEYTFYPPSIPNHYFARKSNYPLFFPKSLVGGVPDTESAKGINSGEAGLEERGTDFLIVDSFTYKRFDDPYTCQLIPVECTFFKRLLAGETRYRLDRIFEYHLPGFLPQLSPFFLNPTIRVYRRSP